MTIAEWRVSDGETLRLWLAKVKSYPHICAAVPLGLRLWSGMGQPKDGRSLNLVAAAAATASKAGVSRTLF